MEKSGIEEVLETIYGPNAVLHILSGKAYARSLRGHLLLQSALEVIILQLNNCLNNDLKDTPVFEPDTVLESVFDEKIEKLWQQEVEILKEFSEFTSEYYDHNNLKTVIEKLRRIIKNTKDVLSELSRTATFWIQYIYYVDIVKDFIRAERTGNWNDHLNSVGRMLNLFAPTGHFNYYIYK